MDALATLTSMRGATKGARYTDGLPEAVLRDFLASDPRLAQAIAEGAAAQKALCQEFPELATLGELDLVTRLQAGYVNFYVDDQRNPYIPVAARGPWIVTFHGAVIHDSGGYGMIGFGHAPEFALEAMARPQVMANIMTASFSQYRLDQRLRREIGHTRGGCPYGKFICVNSGSEAVTVAARLTDINARRMTDPGGRHAGRRIMFLSLKGGFHGRTDRPAQISNSTYKYYAANLASFRGLENNYTIAPNDTAALKEAFAWAEREKVFFEGVFLEPVMGEGDPGKAITPEFYLAARELATAHGSLLVIDSIQAAIRAHGCLSICDYPGFAKLPAPDMETYSKAVNAGQYPLSILAMSDKAAALYVRGVYGNTKTTNPRAVDVAVAVLDRLTPELRRNIVDRGREFLDKFGGLKREFPGLVTGVQGTGLLCSIALDAKRCEIVGRGHMEEYLRRHGIGVIHGGPNSLRFTPHFGITSKEVDLVVNMLREAFKNGPVSA